MPCPERHLNMHAPGIPGLRHNGLVTQHDPSNVTAVTVPPSPPLTPAERSRRYRKKRKTAARQARGYSWPPFEPGNVVALKAGHRSERFVSPLAAEIARQLLDDPAVPGYLAEPVFRAALAAWARCEAKALLVAAYLEGLSIEDQMMPPKPGTAAPLEVWRRLEAAAAGQRAHLGMTPLSRGRLSRDITHARLDIAQLFAQMRDDGDAAGGDGA